MSLNASAGVPQAIQARPDPPDDVLGMSDLHGHLDALIHRTQHLKRLASKGSLPDPLAGKSVVVVFEQNSTRTRISFDLGIQQLGGACSILDSQSSQLARGESLEDTAKVLGRYADAIVYRAENHATLETVSQHAEVPVVHALTDREHPCQVLADLTTLHEHLVHGSTDSLSEKTLAYVGDGNNMCHSYLVGAAAAGMDVAVATPEGYQPWPGVLDEARQLAKATDTEIQLTRDPVEAVAGADAVATDTWISMGDEAEKQQRLEAFEGYTVTEQTLQHAAPDAVFLHCLPGHWGHEATHEVAHGPSSVIFDEAENRLWTQMALLAYLFEADPIPGLDPTNP